MTSLQLNNYALRFFLSLLILILGLKLAKREVDLGEQTLSARIYCSVLRSLGLDLSFLQLELSRFWLVVADLNLSDLK